MLPCPSPPPPSLIPRPEREAVLLAAGLGTVATSRGADAAVAVSTEDERSELGFVSVAWDSSGTAGDSPPSPAQVGEGRRVPQGLGLQDREAAEMETTSRKMGDLQTLESGAGREAVG